ncbi:hypothetical protein Tcan_12886 [Toxocara canis]|uniref:Uncharacterized protein n=1 Tax=Toxocara canis TaxID=6265 RepID=A0A0B2UUQ1_TOXCA|nr:hypothetical protein Tcan_12886 [Toxocara canis]
MRPSAHHKHHHHKHRGEKLNATAVASPASGGREPTAAENQPLEKRTDTPWGDRDERRFGERRPDYHGSNPQQQPRAEWASSYSNPRPGFGGGSSNSNFSGNSNWNFGSSSGMSASRQRSQSPSNRDAYKRQQIGNRYSSDVRHDYYNSGQRQSGYRDYGDQGGSYHDRRDNGGYRSRSDRNTYRGRERCEDGSYRDRGRGRDGQNSYRNRVDQGQSSYCDRGDRDYRSEYRSGGSAQPVGPGQWNSQGSVTNRYSSSTAGKFINMTFGCFIIFLFMFSV